MRKALKCLFLRKGMGIDLPIMIAHKEWGLKPRYLQFAVGHEKRGLNICSELKSFYLQEIPKTPGS